MKFILGKKVAMTQLWLNDQVVPVTKVNVGPCTVLQLKTAEKDGYSAVQLGYGDKRSALISKPLLGHFKGNGTFRYVKEFRLNDEKINDLKAGDKISIATFAIGDRLTITGTSKGKGFQGVVKRHGFHGQDATHGNKDQLRASGSVGAGGVQHVFKGTRMSGRMGGDKVTLHDVEIVAIDEAANSLFVKGAVPGSPNSLVLLSADGELKVGLPETKVEETVGTTDEVIVTDEVAETTEEKVEEIKTEEPVAEVPEEKPVEEAPAEEAKTEEPAVEAPVEESKTEETKTE